MGWQDRQWFFGEIEDMKAVLAVCERWGYGNVMHVISSAWQDNHPMPNPDTPLAALAYAAYVEALALPWAHRYADLPPALRAAWEVVAVALKAHPMQSPEEPDDAYLYERGLC